MNTDHKIAYYREDDDHDHEFLGYLVQDTSGWQAQTIFGYTIARTETREDAEAILNEQGLTYLMGIWQYFDKDEQEWFPCVVKEAYEHRVTVIRTNAMGYQDPDDYKFVTIQKPTENVLIKS